MKTHVLRWVPIALFLFVATLSVRQHLRDAAQTLCRPTPNLCQPDTAPARGIQLSVFWAFREGIASGTRSYNEETFVRNRNYGRVE